MLIGVFGVCATIATVVVVAVAYVHLPVAGATIQNLLDLIKCAIVVGLNSVGIFLMPIMRCYCRHTNEVNPSRVISVRFGSFGSPIAVSLNRILCVWLPKMLSMNSTTLHDGHRNQR